MQMIRWLDQILMLDLIATLVLLSLITLQNSFTVLINFDKSTSLYLSVVMIWVGHARVWLP